MSQRGQGRDSSRRGQNRGELLRKLIHMAVGLGAFAVVLLGPFYSALMAFALVLFNLFVLPRFGGGRLWREKESRRGKALGIVLYPLAVLGLILVFWQRLEVAAAVWGILAFGDGMAALVGGAWGRAKLPWNPEKSWAGTVACWLFGTVGCAAPLWWTLELQGRSIAPAFLLAVSTLTALLAAWVESLPLNLDDNLSVPLLAAAFLAVALPPESRAAVDPLRLLAAAAAAAIIMLGLAWVAYLARARRRGGRDTKGADKIVAGRR